VRDLVEFTVEAVSLGGPWTFISTLCIWRGMESEGRPGTENKCASEVTSGRQFMASFRHFRNFSHPSHMIQLDVRPYDRSMPAPRRLTSWIVWAKWRPGQRGVGPVSMPWKLKCTTRQRVYPSPILASSSLHCTLFLVRFSLASGIYGIGSRCRLSEPCGPCRRASHCHQP